MQTRTYPPRLMRAMIWQGILTESEARSAIVAHRQHDGRYGGSEAVVHYGGATRIIRDAFRNRHVMRQVIARHHKFWDAEECHRQMEVT